MKQREENMADNHIWIMFWDKKKKEKEKKSTHSLSLVIYYWVLRAGNIMHWYYVLLLSASVP